MRRRHLLNDDERNAQTPPLWRVWQVVKATLIAFLLGLVAYAAVGALLVHNADEDQKREDRRDQEAADAAAVTAADRRAGICDAIVNVGPDALARAFHEPTVDNPELEAYKADLRESLGFCDQP